MGSNKYIANYKNKVLACFQTRPKTTAIIITFCSLFFAEMLSFSSAGGLRANDKT